MSFDNERISERTRKWFACMEQFDLPVWDALPQIELYMDQVIILLKQYLAPLYHGEEDKMVTASIINNYVRMKIMPPPVKKKYGRMHIACLIVICALKQSLSISCIQRILPPDKSEEGIRQLYQDFVCQHLVVQQIFAAQVRRGDHPLFAENTTGILPSFAILSNLSTGLTEYILAGDDEETSDKKNKNSAE